MIVHKDLWQKFKSGDVTAYEAIYQMTAAPLLKYGLKINDNIEIVEDCLHDLFVEIWYTRQNLSDTDNIHFYLLKALRYKILKASSKQAIIVDLEKITNGQLEDATENELINQEFKNTTIAQIQKAMDRLPLRHREIIFLKFFYGYTNPEIATLLHIKHQSVANLTQRALHSLKKILATNTTQPQKFFGRKIIGFWLLF